MKSPQLLHEFGTEVASSTIIEKIIDSKQKYSNIRGEFLLHWKPIFVHQGGGPVLVNSVTQTKNVTIDLPHENQAVLYDLREDIYEAIGALLETYNRKYEEK
jgi:hypothetical protein